MHTVKRKHMSLQLFLCLLEVFHLTDKGYASPVTVPVTLTTTLGDVVGVRQTTGATPVDTFYGIPYAQPPVGPLRFKPPVAPEPWDGAKCGLEKPNSCWQVVDTYFDNFWGANMWNPNTPRSEDCLYLNVWRPACDSGCQPKTIMVWIFGGGFFAGTSTLDVYNAAQLAARNDVIVVTIGFRIGIFGFLYLGNDSAPGNAGLLDQVMALKWVNDNAVNLGGSPDDITIFGESSGAVSVGFHLLSPLSKDLFKYAIMQSASPLAFWSLQDVEFASSRARKLARDLSCNLESASDVLTCLQAVIAEKIVNRTYEYSTEPYLDVAFGPVIDGNFLTDNPVSIIKRGEAKKTRVILGVNKNEGYYFEVYAHKDIFDPLNKNGTISETDYQTILTYLFNNDTAVIQEVKQKYPVDSNNSFSTNIDSITGDMFFKCPVVDFAELYSRHSDAVYMYSFEHRTSQTPWPEWMGVLHGYEIEVIFGLPLAAGSNYTEAEKGLSSLMMKLWTDFAKTGKPSPTDEDQWPEYKPDEQAYVAIDIGGLRTGHKLRDDQCPFMDNNAEETRNTTSLRNLENESNNSNPVLVLDVNESQNRSRIFSSELFTQENNENNSSQMFNYTLPNQEYNSSGPVKTNTNQNSGDITSVFTLENIEDNSSQVLNNTLSNLENNSSGPVKTNTNQNTGDITSQFIGENSEDNSSQVLNNTLLNQENISSGPMQRNTYQNDGDDLSQLFTQESHENASSQVLHNTLPIHEYSSNFSSPGITDNQENTRNFSSPFTFPNQENTVNSSSSVLTNNQENTENSSIPVLTTNQETSGRGLRAEWLSANLMVSG
ncbi:cholinesterase 1-like isoform X1 [Biomphalaria glabrata]